MKERILKIILGASLCMSTSIFALATDANVNSFKNMRDIISKSSVNTSKVDLPLRLEQLERRLQQDVPRFVMGEIEQDIEQDNVPFEVVSPKPVIGNHVKKEAEILVSLKLLTSIPATISITRFIEPRSVVFSSERTKEITKLAKEAPLYASEEAKQDRTGTYDLVVEAYIDEEAFDYNAIYEMYENSGEALIDAHDAYQVAYVETLQKFNLEAKELNKIIKNRRVYASGYSKLYAARQAYELAAKNYLKFRNMYESYHKYKILDREDIVIEGALPYYNHVLQSPKFGRYEVIVRDAQTDEIIGDVYEFEISPEEKIKNVFLNDVEKNLRSGILKY